MKASDKNDIQSFCFEKIGQKLRKKFISEIPKFKFEKKFISEIQIRGLYESKKKFMSFLICFLICTPIASNAFLWALLK